MANAQRWSGPSDLHLHSSRSDGTQPPAEVLSSAYEYGLRTVALTDHDTTAGWDEATGAAQALGMTLLPGMEFSTRYQGGSTHMLAYLFDPDHEGILAEREKIRADRLSRAERIVRNIRADYTLDWEDVLAQRTQDASVGRPHIADAMIARGIVKSREEAFAGILHPRMGYIIPLYAPDPRDAVRLVAAAGGVSVIAHPAGRNRMLAMPIIEELIELGLGGFEIGHRENTPEGQRVLSALAEKHDLIVTGSSDYHGSGKPNLPGENTTTDKNVARIIAQATGTEPVYPD